MKKRRKRITRRNIIEDVEVKTPKQHFEIDRMEIAEFSPAMPDADSEVHILLFVKGCPDIPFTIRFQSPDTLGDWIVEMERYRKQVFPDAPLLEFIEIADTDKE